MKRPVFLLITFVVAFVVLPNKVLNAQENKASRSLKWKVAIGRFSNETQYGKGIFYDRDNDPMAKQALDILTAKLAASGKFILLERSDAEALAQEVEQGKSTEKVLADFVILGSITEFGRKTTGKEQIFTAEKTQKVEAGVSLRVVDVNTNMVFHSEEAKGYAETTSKSTLGLGGKAGYDATLSDKAISSAMDQLVENLTNKLADKPWRTYIISADNDGIFISGGSMQGVNVGDTFDLYEKGKQVRNPQTGVMVDLPGKKVATLRVDTCYGDNALNEISSVSVISGGFDSTKISSYYVQEIK